MAKIALLILGGDASEKDFQLVKDYEFVCCADSGTDTAMKQNIIPNLAIGDFDSASKESLNWATSVGCKTISYPSDKNESDGEICLKELKTLGYEVVKIIGAFGKRPDHTMFNLFWFHLEEMLGIKLFYYNHGFEIQSVTGKCNLDAKPGTLVSFHPFFGKAKITLEGFEYPYDDTMIPGLTRTLSNITRENANATVDGKALMFVRLLLA